MRLLGSSSQHSSWRASAEGGLRILVVGLLAWYLIQVIRARSGGTPEVGTSAELPALLTRWTTMSNPTRVHVALEYPPPLAARDWLAALPGAGTRVRWSGAALVPTAATIEPVADPFRGADLAVAAPESATVVLRDALGAFDTVRSTKQGARVYLPKPPGAAEAVVGPVVARAPLRDSLKLGRLLVVGGAGWEAKFVTAALEERGWKVDAFLAVSPKGQGDVRQGKVTVIDTATYAAVLALDTVAGRFAEKIVQYVQSGGGLVLWATATATPGLAALVVGAVDAVKPDDGQLPSDTAPRMALALAPITRLQPDAVVLEQQQQRTALAARRIGPGRVIQTGYVDSWRWRLVGSDEQAPAAHREWLARLVADVAYAGRHPLAAPAADVAPLATLVDRLGPSTPETLPQRAGFAVGPWIFVVLVLALIAEWASRRLRGVK